MSITWNLWHGCHKLSPGCQHCYVYRMDSKYEKDSSNIYKTANFDLPIKKNRNGAYKIPSGELVYTCFTSDFLLEEADVWRQQAWQMMHLRSDLQFRFVTKRIHRLLDCLPPNWGDGYENVFICCTVENQDRADFRLPILSSVPAKHKSILCEPLLEEINLSPYLGSWIEEVAAGGESGSEARLCDYNWVLSLRQQCINHQIPFTFHQTGANFRKENKLYRIERSIQQTQARKANIDYVPPA